MYFAEQIPVPRAIQFSGGGWADVDDNAIVRYPTWRGTQGSQHFESSRYVHRSPDRVLDAMRC